jgi:DNA polymerase-1
MSKKIYIDGDMLLYRAAFAAEKEIRWDDDIFTVHSDFSDLKDSYIMVTDCICEILDAYEDNGDEITMVFSDRYTFRHELNLLYKAHRRDKRSPLGINDLREWACDEWKSLRVDRLEADDVLGIIGSRDPDGSVIVSGDKDFATVPCTWYNFLKDDLRKITKMEADFQHLVQTLAGDATDGYFGVPRVGLKTAEKILNKDGAEWQTVVNTYEKAGMTEEDALLNARMAFILRDGYYNKETKEITLWTPTQ